ncbi:zinc ribbon domain-containing protein [Coleofasciculus sp.]|uniref:zinc ribbon domain-containing protein n=1 Tax=Coleofasciculus sp. TaxID=3100458 RepID=UPI0039F8FE64
MQITYKFKLKPNKHQEKAFEQDRLNIRYVKNRMIGDREFTCQSRFILGDYCSLYNKQTYWVTTLRSDIETYINVNPRKSSQECSECGFTSPKNRDKEKFVCECCGHYAGADIDAAIVIANRAKEKLGIVSLPLVNRKVTPKPEITGSPKKRESLGLLVSPRNPSSKVKYKVKYVQFDLFNLKTEWETR